jgi:hypothetical protein
MKLKKYTDHCERFRKLRTVETKTQTIVERFRKLDYETSKLQGVERF